MDKVTLNEYDERGNEIHSKDLDGYEVWKDFDENGNITHCKASNGSEYWKEYDELFPTTVVASNKYEIGKEKL